MSTKLKPSYWGQKRYLTWSHLTTARMSTNEIITHIFSCLTQGPSRSRWSMFRTDSNRLFRRWWGTWRPLFWIEILKRTFEQWSTAAVLLSRTQRASKMNKLQRSLVAAIKIIRAARIFFSSNFHIAGSEILLADSNFYKRKHLATTWVK